MYNYCLHIWFASLDRTRLYNRKKFYFIFHFNTNQCFLSVSQIWHLSLEGNCSRAIRGHSNVVHNFLVCVCVLISVYLSNRSLHRETKSLIFYKDILGFLSYSPQSETVQVIYAKHRLWFCVVDDLIKGISGNKISFDSWKLKN